MSSTPFYIIHRRQIDYLLSHRESGTSSWRDRTNYVIFYYPPNDPGILPSGEILKEITFILYWGYEKDIAKRLFKQESDLYPTLDSIIAHVNEGQSPEFFYYLFSDGKIDLYIGFDDMDPNKIEKRMNKYVSILDNYNFFYNRLSEFIHVPNVDSVIVHLIGASNDDDNLPVRLQKLDMALLINKYPHLVYDLIKWNLSLYPEYMQVARREASQYQNLYDLGLLYLDYYKHDKSKQLSEIYLILAEILTSNPGRLTDAEQLLVLDYLIKADDLPAAKRLRTQLFWDWVGKQESFEINLDVLTLFNLMKAMKKSD